ncbi:MAG: DUF3866 family protein [Dermatophilaceae bacterium]
MILWREATVERVRARWPGAVECDVVLRGPDSETPVGETLRALAYTDLVGEPVVGDRVLLNVSALELGLGTGGMALMVAIPDRLPADHEPGPGHIVKARYTPLQTVVLGVDEQESPHHDILSGATGIGAMPVILADLHSAVPAILAGLREAHPEVRVAYVMTDGGALPIAFSRTVAGLSRSGWLTGTITVGQAFGGDLEAVNVHTGLLAAAHVLHAEVAIVAQGPGNLGTDSPWGFSGVSTGEAVNATAALGGRAIASLRISEADERERHRGISHHSLTSYGKVAMAAADLPVPLLGGPFGDRVLEQARELSRASAGRLQLREVDTTGLVEVLASSPVRLSTMGRGLDQDQASFVAAAAAGRFAATVLNPLR